MTITYAVQHPDMSEALIVEAHRARLRKGLIAQCFMYMLENFGEALSYDEWVITTIDSSVNTIDLFAVAR
jgi:hypothetical protein